MILKLLMKDTMIRRCTISIVQIKKPKKNFEIFYASRCLKLGFEEFIDL